MYHEYFLGLDIGTGSVGWAVTDKKYELLRSHGKTMWGVRLFETANTAEERRTFRTARRRLQRRNWRIELLQGLFADEINKVDDGFFHRMKESQYVKEDKRDINGVNPILPYALFVDKDYTDKDYHKQFPTIYHLRKWLMETDTTPDIRLVYLAIHHIMKHRGHFLFSGNLDNIRSFDDTFQQFYESLKNEELSFELEFDEESIRNLESILKDSSLTRSAKKTKLLKVFQAKNSCEKAILGLLCGVTVKLSDIFDNSELDSAEKPKICFAESSYEDNIGIYENELGELYYIIEQAKSIYDWSILVDILGEHDSISKAKVELYEKHKKDLVYLKQIVKKYLSKEEYQEIFVTTNDKLDNYCAYIGMTKVNGRKVPMQGKQCAQKAFYDFLKKRVASKIDSEEIAYLKEELEKESFLPKQVTTDNGVLPHQVHLYELKQILENLKEKLPLLQEHEEKILQIFMFRIPYYVGPLNGITKGEQKTNWMVRNTNDKIYPWNFEQVVNIEESAEKFIRRMTNKCTYLIHEDVLPKNSLLYSKFVVLNELNNLRLNGEPIDVALKQNIYHDLFQRMRKVTQKKLKDYLVRQGVVGREVEITGIDGDFKGSLVAYHDFKEKLTGVELTQEEKETIILNITLFGEDKKLLKQRLSKLFPQLTDAQKTALTKLSYNGWGRLSEKLLSGITAPDPQTGEAWSILRSMWETNDNFMQILSEKYMFASYIEEENHSDVSKEITYKMVDELYVSPAVKRQIWQTLIIVKEITKIMGHAPERVFIEMAREKADSNRTESRKNKLLELYKKCKEDERTWIEKLKNIEDSTLRSDKLYLYYTQKGRCMYSGEIIELEDLWDNNKYDIDHIYPQSKVMDDSLDNRVLVKKSYNAKKTDEYPIKKEIRNHMSGFWKVLLDGGFISKVKYERLVRGTEFDSNELAGFIERQLVETRQGTKAVASILKQTLPETEIVYAKAKSVSKFRHDFEMIKVRDMNDLHHAKDAYLNIVVGNTYFVKFTKNAAWFIRENPGRTYSINNMFKSKDVERNGEIAWIAGEKGTIRTVRATMCKNNVLVTRKAYEKKGVLFDVQLVKKGNGQVPIKESNSRLSNINKYGGYNNATGSYFMLVESDDKKGNKIRTIEYVPLYLKTRIEKKQQEMLDILQSERGLVNPRIIIPKIKIDTLFNVDGFYMYISGRSDSRIIFKNAMQLLLPKDKIEILKKITKFIEKKKFNKELKIVAHDKLTDEDILILYKLFIQKMSQTIYKIFFDKIADKLQKREAEFQKLCIEDKCIIIMEILHILQCNSVKGDLKLIGETKSAGLLRINKTISNLNHISIINQSPTGIYEHEIDLKTV